MSRVKKFLFSLLLGLIAGLLYGWLINPVEYVDTNPQFLSQDFRTDIVLMTAEIFEKTGNLQFVSEALNFLFSQIPTQLTSDAVTYAHSAGYAQIDITLLENLNNSLFLLQGNNSP